MCRAGLPEETQGHTGVGPANDCEGGPWIGASDLGGEAGGVGLFSLEQRRLWWYYQRVQIPEGGSKEEGARLFSEVPSDRMDGNGHKLKLRTCHLNRRKGFFYRKGAQTLEQVSREVVESPFLDTGQYSKPDWTWLRDTCSRGCCFM